MSVACFWRRAGFMGWLFAACFAMGMASAFAAPAADNHEVISPNEAAGFIAETSETAFAILGDTSLTPAQRNAELRKLITDKFNMRYIALYSLGAYRRHVETDDLLVYEDLFTDFVVEKYIAMLDSYAGHELIVSQAEPAGTRDALVRTQIETITDAPLETEWRVRIFAGQPRIIDISVAGLSLVQSQREEFSEVISRAGFAGLIDVLKSTYPNADRA